jgi:threonine dehydrogenase-like Zn-dependent dehydrogenase
VPYADVGLLKVPSQLRDEQVLFLSDIFPTGYMAADFCEIQPDDTIAVWGCGPVGQFAIRSAFLLGAHRVIAIDTVAERLALAREAGAETLDFKKEDIYSALQEATQDRGPDACIDAVGTEADTTASLDSVIDRVKVATFVGTDRPHVLRQAIHCRNFGIVSIVGVYGGFLDKIPMGSAINRGLKLRMAQTPVQRYMPSLLERIEKGEIDPSFVVTHRAALSEGPDLYKTFRDKKDGCHQGRDDPVTNGPELHGAFGSQVLPLVRNWPRCPTNQRRVVVAARSSRARIAVARTFGLLRCSSRPPICDPLRLAYTCVNSAPMKKISAE